MQTRTHKLRNGWTFIAHRLYDVYSNGGSNYAIIDQEHDVVMRFTVQDNEFESKGSNWHVNYKINIGLKTIKVLTDPEKD